MKIAVEGCCHGELDKIYETLTYIEQREGVKVDLLLVCGDFQAVRNRSDLKAMAVPVKFQQLNTFYKYYSGEKVAPVLTIFIGGNHEASNYLQELPYGGWVAPNIYYLGYAGVVQFGGLRLAGVSGIYKGRDYTRGHYEHPPYNEDTKRSCYHIRNLEVFRLKQLKQPIDIFLSHDWPEGIYNHGDSAALVRRKPFFEAEVAAGTLGSRPAAELLHFLRPAFWFAAHLHVKFAAVVHHPPAEDGEQKLTKFLALDKCLPRRQFLQLLDIEPRVMGQPMELQLDPEWLCVLRSTDHLLGLTRANCYMPGPGGEERFDFSVTDVDLAALAADFGGVFKIPLNFQHTAPPHSASQRQPLSGGAGASPRTPVAQAAAPQICINPQTTLLCEMIGLTDPNAVFSGGRPHPGGGIVAGEAPRDEGDSLDVDDRDEGILDDSDLVSTGNDYSTLEGVSFNPDEIDIDGIGEEDGEDAEAGGEGSSEREKSQKGFGGMFEGMGSSEEGVESCPRDLIDDSDGPVIGCAERPVLVGSSAEPKRAVPETDANAIALNRDDLEELALDGAMRLDCNSMCPLARSIRDAVTLTHASISMSLSSQQTDASPLWVAPELRMVSADRPVNSDPSGVAEGSGLGCAAEGSEPAMTLTQPRKMKRRNVALYAMLDEDENV